MHACIHKYIHTYLHSYTRIHTYIHTFTHAYVYTYVCLGCSNVAWKEAAKELGTLRAKFELTLQTLRSILGLELNCSWADIVEHVELLGRLADGHKGQDKSIKEEDDDEESEAEELRQLLLQAEMDLDEKEQQLEEQCARVRDLSDVLSKQQNHVARTCAQLSNQNEQKDLVSKQREELLRTTADRDRLNDERNRLREETRKLRELNVFQQKHLQEKESQLAIAEASLVEKHTSLARREQELGDLQADHERQRAEIEELCDVVASRDDEVDRIRSQLEVYEAAERRKHSRVPSVGASSDSRELSVQGQRSTPNLGMLHSETARRFRRCPGAQQLPYILKHIVSQGLGLRESRIWYMVVLKSTRRSCAKYSFCFLKLRLPSWPLRWLLRWPPGVARSHLTGLHERMWR
ncbi:unnamed protein product [Symbiodinium sp. CCMP2592]|nr:unnamed protein product [Symbiodinium sp. CCMP2592]